MKYSDELHRLDIQQEAQGGYSPPVDSSSSDIFSNLRLDAPKSSKESEYTPANWKDLPDDPFNAAERRYNLPAGILKSIAQTESGFNPKAKSPAGAIGMMQFMPKTAKKLGFDPRDPIASIDGAGRLLDENLKRFNGDIYAAVAAYNAGPQHAEDVAAGKAKPFKETEDYVKKVFGLTGDLRPQDEPTASNHGVKDLRAEIRAKMNLPADAVNRSIHHDINQALPKAQVRGLINQGLYENTLTLEQKQERADAKLAQAETVDRQAYANENPKTAAAMAFVPQLVTSLANVPGMTWNEGAKIAADLSGSDLNSFEDKYNPNKIPGLSVLNKFAKDYTSRISSASVTDAISAGDYSKAADIIATGAIANADNIAAIGVAYVNPAAALYTLGLMGAKSAGATYQNNIDRGMDQHQAFLNASAKGALEVITEKTGLDLITHGAGKLAFSEALTTALGSKFAKAAGIGVVGVVGSGIEGAEEAINQGAGNAVDMITGQFTDGKLGQSLQDTKLLQGTGDAAVLGTAIGALGGGIQAHTMQRQAEQLDSATKFINYTNNTDNHVNLSDADLATLHEHAVVINTINPNAVDEGKIKKEIDRRAADKAQAGISEAADTDTAISNFNASIGLGGDLLPTTPVTVPLDPKMMSTSYETGSMSEPVQGVLPEQVQRYQALLASDPATHTPADTAFKQFVESSLPVEQVQLLNTPRFNTDYTQRADIERLATEGQEPLPAMSKKPLSTGIPAPITTQAEVSQGETAYAETPSAGVPAQVTTHVNPTGSLGVTLPAAQLVAFKQYAADQGLQSLRTVSNNKETAGLTVRAESQEQLQQVVDAFNATNGAVQETSPLAAMSPEARQVLIDNAETPEELRSQLRALQGGVQSTPTTTATKDQDLDIVQRGINADNLSSANAIRERDGLEPLTNLRADRLVDIRELTVQEVSHAVPAATRLGVRLIAKAFGKQVRYIKDNNGNKLHFQGLYAGRMGADQNSIFLTAEGSNLKGDSKHISLLRVVGHEILHAVSKQDNANYKILRNIILNNINTDEAKAQLVAEGYGSAEDIEANWALPDSTMREEVIGNVLGDKMVEPQFWLDLMSNLGSAKAKSIMDSILNKINAVLGLAQKDATPISKATIKDMTTVHDAIVAAMGEYKRKIDSGEIDSAPVSEVDTTEGGIQFKRGDEEERVDEFDAQGGRDYKLDITRKDRDVNKVASIAKSEMDAVHADAVKHNLSKTKVNQILSEARETKTRFPVTAGWAPLVLKGIAVDTNKETGKVKISPKWGTIQYGFNKVSEDKLVDKFHALIKDIYSRAEAGDKNALTIVSHQTWYRNVAAVLRHEYGGFGDTLADLLGATSPNTPVDTNWRFSVEILQRMISGEFNTELNAFVKYVDEGGQLSKFHNVDKIRQISGKLYGMNSLNAMKALTEMWRVIEPGTAPKARNFALNLIGQSNMATIDVWAARMLRRAANLVRGESLPRIPPPAEQGVTGNWNSKATEVTGEFGNGAKVMARVSTLLENDNIFVTPPDLQAIAWFAEKELWGENGWTTVTGEGGSFEENLDKQQRNRYISGFSIQQGEKAPDGANISVAQARVLTMMSGDDSVLAARVMPTNGLYAGVIEQSFDAEWVVDKTTHDPSLIMAEIAKIASENSQYDMFVSRVLADNEDSPNSRPGVEVYFKDKQSLEKAMPVLEKFVQNGQDGFTMVVDPRAKGTDSFIGVRLQYVPEISMRWDSDLRARLQQEGEIEKELADKTTSLDLIVDEVRRMEGVAHAVVVKYDTVVIGKENYDGYINRGASSADQSVGGESWFGQPIRQGLKRAAARLDSESGQDSEASVSNASSEVSEKGLAFSRKFGAEVVEALRDMAEVDGIFEYPKVNAKTFNDTVAGMGRYGKELAVSQPITTQDGNKKYTIRNKLTGRIAFMLEDKKGRLWLNLAQLKSQKDRGSLIYSAAADYAFYNNKVFIGDPAGLSDIALFRRTENMLSIALKYGTTKHIEPHHKQVAPRDYYGEYDFGPFAAKAQALQWKEGDDDFNIASLAYTGYTNLLKLIPEVEDARWNPETRAFEWSSGRPFDANAFAEYSSVRAIRESGFGDLVTRTQNVDGSQTEFGPVGVRTLRRAVIIGSIIRATDLEAKAAITSQLSAHLRRTSTPAKQSDSGRVGELGSLPRPSVKNDPEFEGLMYKRTSPFYSQLSKAISEQPDRIFNQPAKAIALWLNSNASKLGIKKDEIQWSGITDWLALQPGKVSKADIQNYLDKNGVQVTETKLQNVDAKGIEELASEYGYTAEYDPYDEEYVFIDDNDDDMERVGTSELPRALQKAIRDSYDGPRAKYQDYTVPGGENYTELLLTLPENKKTETYADWVKGGMVGEFSSKGTSQSKTLYKSGHWDQPNILAHVRYDERTDGTGAKTLFIQEIQSDWGQEGRKGGFKGTPNIIEDKGEFSINGINRWFKTREDAIQFAEERNTGAAAAPFVTDTKSWVALALKRMIAHAVQIGADKIAIINGDQAAGLYNLSKSISNVTVQRFTGGAYGFSIIAKDLDGKVILNREEATLNNLADFVGKDLSENIKDDFANKPGDEHSYSGLALDIGGEGMKVFYDTLIPQVANDVLKKIGGGKVGTYELATPRPNTAIVIEDLGSFFVVDKYDIESEYGQYDTRLEARLAVDKLNRSATSTQVSFDITPEMKSKVEMEGLPLFKRTPMPVISGLADRALDRMDAAINGTGTLPELNSFMISRKLTAGKIAGIDAQVKKMAEVFYKASDADKTSVYDYLTTAGASAKTIANVEVRAKAIEVKKSIDATGQEMVSRGMLSQVAYDAHKDAYLPRLYLSHLLSESDRAKIQSGYKPSSMGYLKQRKDIPEPIRRLILGEIKDPAFLTAHAIAQPMRDMALLDWLDTISQNNNWIAQDSVIDYNGRKVSTMWMKHQAEKMRKIAQLVPSADRAAVLQIATDMEAKANVHLGSDIDHTVYKQLPDTAKYGMLRGMYVRKEIAHDIMGVAKLNPEDMTAVESVLGYGGIGSRLTSAWKFLKVAANPAGQVRNFVSNMVMLQLSGISLHRMPSRMIQAIDQIRNGGKYWDIVNKFGVLDGTFTTQELRHVSDKFTTIEAKHSAPVEKLILFGHAFHDLASGAYMKIEALGKLMKIIDCMETDGMSAEEAVLEADKWLFDYGLLNNNLKQLRNQPVGSPFITYAAKAAPRLLEVAAKYPWRFAPWVALSASFPMMFAAAFGGDDDDYAKVKKAMPDWIAKNPHAVLLPYKDDNGSVVVMNLGYFFPWSQWTGLGQDMLNGDLTNVVSDAGLGGGPVLGVIEAARTGVDPFTKRKIMDSNDPIQKQAMGLMNYVWDMATIPVMASSGVLSPMWGVAAAVDAVSPGSVGDPAQYGGKLAQAASKTTNKYGEVKSTYAQAAGRLAGVNTYGIDPEASRERNIKTMERGIADIKSRRDNELKNEGLTDDQYNSISDSYDKVIEGREAELDLYMDESELPNYM